MADGTTKPILEVKVGDQVLATDPETGEQGPREVTAVWVHQDRLLNLELKDREDETVTVTTTEDHPFWNNTDQGWQEAQDLDAGDALLSTNGRTITVSGLDLTTQHTGAAYNLTVKDLHTYHVAASDQTVLVHNICPDRPPFYSPKLRQQGA